MTTKRAQSEDTGEPVDQPPAPFVSEGLRVDLVQYGQATDPATGAVLAMDPDTGDITVTARDVKGG